MSNASWELEKSKLRSKENGLEKAALESLRQGKMGEARKYAQQADSLKFAHQNQSGSNRPEPTIDGVVPVKIIRKKKH